MPGFIYRNLRPLTPDSSVVQRVHPFVNLSPYIKILVPIPGSVVDLSVTDNLNSSEGAPFCRHRGPSSQNPGCDAWTQSGPKDQVYATLDYSGGVPLTPSREVGGYVVVLVGDFVSFDPWIVDHSRLSSEPLGARFLQVSRLHAEDASQGQPSE